MCLSWTCVRSSQLLFQAAYIRLVSLNFTDTDTQRHRDTDTHTYTHILLSSVPMSDRRHLPPAICNYFLPVSRIFMDTSEINIHSVLLLGDFMQDTTKPLEGRGSSSLQECLLFSCVAPAGWVFADENIQKILKVR